MIFRQLIVEAFVENMTVMNVKKMWFLHTVEYFHTCTQLYFIVEKRILILTCCIVCVFCHTFGIVLYDSGRYISSKAYAYLMHRESIKHVQSKCQRKKKWKGFNLMLDTFKASA